MCVWGSREREEKSSFFISKCDSTPTKVASAFMLLLPLKNSPLSLRSFFLSFPRGPCSYGEREKEKKRKEGNEYRVEEKELGSANECFDALKCLFKSYFNREN